MGIFLLIRFFLSQINWPDILSSGFAQFEKKASHKWFPHFCCHNLRSIVLMMIFGLSDLLGVKHFTSGVQNFTVFVYFHSDTEILLCDFQNKSQITKKYTDGNKLALWSFLANTKHHLMNHQSHTHYKIHFWTPFKNWNFYEKDDWVKFLNKWKYFKNDKLSLTTTTLQRQW